MKTTGSNTQGAAPPATRLVFLALALFCASPTSALALERLEPLTGCLTGILIDDSDTPATVSARLGFTPAVFVKFVSFPMDSASQTSVGSFLQMVRASGGIAMLTLEPFSGLDPVTPQTCIDLANLCASHEADGIAGIMIRFAHEMNGNWYPWGQKPALYCAKFQLLAQEIHTRTLRTGMVWAPNNGVGYPYGTGPYSAAPGSADFQALDTDHNFYLSESDDMFGPFYPGDSAVDWVGLTIYHWGNTYPWLENEPPVGSEFADIMNATDSGSPTGFARWFYPRFCEDAVHKKPLIIAETAAFYNTEQPGGNEVAMKSAWFRQVFNIAGPSADGPDVATTFPKMKCISWFDFLKPEGQAQNQFIDWRVSGNPLVRNAYRAAVRTPRNGASYFLTAQEFTASQAANGLTADLPAILPLYGTVTATIRATAQAACDLVVDLLDRDFVYKGGTRIPIAAGSSTVPVTIAPNETLIDGTGYRWSIFLTPTGAAFPNTLARCIVPDSIARAVTPVVVIESAPPSTPPGAAFTVRVRYTAAADSMVHLTLADPMNVARGEVAIAVQRGDGLVDLALEQQPGNSPGAYALRCELVEMPQTVVAQSAERLVQIVSAPLGTPAVTLTAEPVVLPVGEVVRFSVGYATASARDLRLELQNASSTVVASAVQPVDAGNGCIDMTFAYPLASPGTYTARVHVVPSGGTAAQALASSTPQTLYLVSRGYADWTSARWGVIFGNDPIAPLLDPDGDGAMNQDEYVALTDPRSSASVLRTSIGTSGSLLEISWPSVAGRNYQLFSRSDLESGSWIPATAPQPGTGTTMQFQADPGTFGARCSFRLQVSIP